MTLWLGVHFLLAALLLCSAAPMPEECDHLLKPVSLADRSTLFGRMYSAAAYTNHAVYKDILKVVDNCWSEISPSVSGDNEFVLRSWDKINGTCLISTMKAVITGDTAAAEFYNMTSSFQRLPSSDGSMFLNSSTTIQNPQELYDLLRLKSSAPTGEITFPALYLMVSDPNVTDSVLEEFKKTASCMGFSEELDYQHDTEKSFCAEDEGHRVVPSDRSQCDIMKYLISVNDLHKVAGDWVLVHSVSDGADEWETELSSSHSKLHVNNNNMTVMLHERNLFINNSCTTYSINMEVLQDDNQTNHHLLRSTVVKFEVEGVGQDNNETYTVEVFQICPDCLQLLYTESTGTKYLLDYKREGSHREDHLKSDGHSSYQMNAECLGFSYKKVFKYDGVAAFCPTESPPVDVQKDS